MCVHVCVCVCVRSETDLHYSDVSESCLRSVVPWFRGEIGRCRGITGWFGPVRAETGFICRRCDCISHYCNYTINQSNRHTGV